MTKRLFAALVLLAFAVLPAAAQDRRSTTPASGDAAAPEKGKEKDKDKKEEEKPPSVTHHTMTLGGKPFAYTATAGYMPMKDENGKLKANIFYVAYTKDGASNQRPMTYAFNGGPGSSSVWLHLGAIGPKRVLLTDEGWAPPPPYRLVDNEQTWLAFTDLVFIDPVTTGFSRPAEGEKPEQFHGLEEDLQSVGDFIRLWTTRYSRWASPKFLAGESYGTTRAAGLSGYLQNRHGMYLNGIVLMSTILNFQTARFDVGNDLPYVLFLPSYTAAAWYHKKLARRSRGEPAEGARGIREVRGRGVHARAREGREPVRGGAAADGAGAGAPDRALGRVRGRARHAAGAPGFQPRAAAEGAARRRTAGRALLRAGARRRRHLDPIRAMRRSTGPSRRC